MLGNTTKRTDSKLNRHDSIKSKSPIAKQDGRRVGKKVGVIVKDQSHLKKLYGENVEGLISTGPIENMIKFDMD